MFVYRRGKDMVILLLYVDDIILTASSTSLLSSIITYIQQEFAISNLGDLHYFWAYLLLVLLRLYFFLNLNILETFLICVTCLLPTQFPHQLIQSVNYR